MTGLVFLKLLGGLVALVVGGDSLIRGASKIAASLGISSLVIGLTVVAFGTSAPELVVSLQSSFKGYNEIAIANVVGSNIFNTLLILGACAIFAPLIVSSQLVRIDVPLMMASSLLLLFFSYNGLISTFEGFILIAILVAYTVFLVKKSRKESREVKAEFDQEYALEKLNKKSLSINLLFFVVGLGLLILGGDWFVAGAVEIAQALGVSETVIGLTIIAGGTSLPEVVTSIIATIKGERDIAIGNVVGSNIFNVLLIIGMSSIITPIGLNVPKDMLYFDYPVMIAASIACLPIFLAGFKITRWDGAVLLTSYFAYLGFVVLKATNHVYFASYHSVVMYFIIPIILLSLIVSSVQAYSTLRKR